jgi:hypothetical protein
MPKGILAQFLLPFLSLFQENVASIIWQMACIYPSPLGFFFPIPLKIHSHMTRRSIICNRAAHVSLRPQRRTRNFRNFQQHRRKQLQYILCEQSTKLLITRIADDLFYCKPGKQQNNHVHQLSSIHTRSTFVQQFTISAERYASSCRMNWLI